MPNKYAGLMLLALVFPLRLAAAPCTDTVHADCLVHEIAAYRAAATDEFQRERIGMSLASAQLAAGLPAEAQSTMDDMPQPQRRVMFLADQAAYLLAHGNKREALEALHEVDDLLGTQAPRARLNYANVDLRIARLMAQAGAPQEGKAVLDKLADVRKLGVPMNAMMLALILQAAQTLADIGYQSDAAQLARSSFAQGFADDMQVSPEQLFRLYAAWAKVDPGAAPRDDATILARELEEEESWLYAGIVWAGPANAPATSPEAAASLLDKARKALGKAPERAEALSWQARVAALLYQARETELALGLLEDVRTQTEALSELEEQAQVQFEIAKAQIAMGSAASAVRSLQTVDELSRQAALQSPMARRVAMNVPVELAVLGHVDDAHELAMDHEDGIRELILHVAASRLVLQKDYANALHFARELPGDQAAMVMAVMATQIAGIDVGEATEP